MRRSVSASVLALVAVAFLAVPASAASKTEAKLLKLVPADVGGVLVVNDLAKLYDQFMAGRLWAKIQESPQFKAWLQSDKYAEFLKNKKQFQDVFGVSIEELAKNVAGQSVVIAFNPPAEGQKKGPGVALSVVKDADAVRQAIEKLEQIAQHEGGLIHRVDKSVGEVSYQDRMIRKKDGTEQQLFSAVTNDNVLVLTDNEALIKAVLERVGGGGDGNMADNARFIAAMKKLKGSPPVKAFLNPRAFDAAIARKHQAEGMPPMKRRFVQMFGQMEWHSSLQMWKATDSLAAGLDFQNGAGLQMVFTMDKGKLPEPMQDLMATAAQPSKIWNVLPANPVGVIAGRLDVPALVRMIGEVTGPPQGKAAQVIETVKQFLLATFQAEDIEKDVLAKIGPDFALVATAPEDGIPTVGLVVKVDTKPIGPDQLTFQQQIHNQLAVWARVGVAQARKPGQPGPKFVNITEEGIKGFCLTDLPKTPPGVAIGFATAGDYVIVASSKDALLQLARRATAAAPADGKLARLRATQLREADALVYLDIVQCRTLLKKYGKLIIAGQVAKGKKTQEQAEQEQATLMSLMELVDNCYIAKDIGSDAVTVSIRVNAAE